MCQGAQQNLKPLSPISQGHDDQDMTIVASIEVWLPFHVVWVRVYSL